MVLSNFLMFTGSVAGCLIDLDAKEIIFSLDGTEGFVFKEVFTDKK